MVKADQQFYGNEVLVWGCKKDYRVCRGQSNPLKMTRISNLGLIKSVTCGYHHTLVITKEGQLFGWGKNTERQVSHSSKDSISSPTPVLGFESKASMAAAGWGHNFLLTEEGKVYAWGYG